MRNLLLGDNVCIDRKRGADRDSTRRRARRNHYSAKDFPMNVAQIATARRTCKAFDPSRKIPAAQIEQLKTLLRYSPSSTNSQPWHFVLASTEAGKAKVAESTSGFYVFNAAKVQNASHVVVLCVREDLDEAHLQALLTQEAQDGRFASAEAQANQHALRSRFVSAHREVLQDAPAWMEKQVYLALGTLLLGAAALGIDACPIEGFDVKLLNDALDLRAQGLSAVVVVALGYRAADDFNAALPKSRLPMDEVLSEI